MDKNHEDQGIKKCIRIIEEKLGWGNSTTWSQYDFEKLSNTIQEATQVKLSITTLKRIWGKLKYENVPTLTTLNTLARFAGFNDWRDFTIQSNVEENKQLIEEGLAETTAKSASKKPIYYYAVSLVLVVVAAYFLISFTARSWVDADKFKFKANKIISEGVPNSVLFHYDAHAARTDSVFIVQTWDVSRKKLVSKEKTTHSAIYYYPGFFRTKLIADGEVVKSHDLMIATDGWLCLAENSTSVPVYFTKEECIKDNVVEVNEEVLHKYGLSLHPNAPKIRFFNQRDLGDITNDNFVFETNIRSVFEGGAGACQKIQVLIQCKDDIIIIPLAATACVGDLSLWFCGVGAESSEDDLSKFGCDLSQWTTLRIETVNKHAQIFVNGKRAYALDFPNDPTGIVGVQYRFNGPGAVKDTKFEYKGAVIKM